MEAPRVRQRAYAASALFAGWWWGGPGTIFGPGMASAAPFPAVPRALCLHARVAVQMIAWMQLSQGRCALSKHCMTRRKFTCHGTGRGGGGAIKEVHRMSENTWREAAQWGGCLPFPPVLQPGVAGPHVLPQLHRLPVKEVKSRWVISTSSQQFSICSWNWLNLEFSRIGFWKGGGVMIRIMFHMCYMTQTRSWGR